MPPSLPLGVPLMDADHEALERLLARVPVTADDALAALFAEIETEIVEHFAREEELMNAVGVPVLHCHVAQHDLLLAEVARLRPAEDGPVDAEALRRALAVVGELVAGHVASVDRVTAQFLRGTLDMGQVAALRLPEAAV